MKRNIAVLSLALAVIVVLTVLIFQQPPGSSIRAAVQWRLADVEAASRSMARSPFHRQRMESLYRQLLDDGVRARDEGRLTDAEALFQRALRLSPGDTAVMRHLGLVAYRGGRFERAAAYFEACLAQHPGQLTAYTDLAIAQVRAGELAAAEHVLRRGLAEVAEGAHGPLHFVLYRVCEAQGKVAEAEAQLAAAQATLGPDALDAVQRLWPARPADPPPVPGDATDHRRPASTPLSESSPDSP